MKRWTASAVAGLLLLSGCGNSVKETLGIERRPPDEFAVLTHAPLSLPPDFALRPPQPGERRPQDPVMRDQARSILLNQASGPTVAVSDGTALTPGERALLTDAEAGAVDPGIRRLVDRESAAEARDDRNFVERLMFWIDRPPPGTVVNAPEERRRLQENTALGRPVTAGETPTIERKSDNRGISIF